MCELNFELKFCEHIQSMVPYVKKKDSSVLKYMTFRTNKLVHF
jgi:hypothetical protein